MPLKLMYITNQESIAAIAEKSGVDWIFIDLEINGKEERQGHLDTVISHHTTDDVKKIRAVLTKAKLLVRVNPIYEGSAAEIERAVGDGADIVMLPFFKTKAEVETFIRYIGGRAKTCLLCETAEAVENLDEIIAVKGIDYIHIGINDLHLEYKMKFMFELLADGTVEKLCEKFKAAGIPYGFGGIARIGQGTLPAENIIAEHYRLGSSQVILSRSFLKTDLATDLTRVEKIFKNDIAKIRTFEERMLTEDESFFIKNREEVKEKVAMIVSELTGN